MSEHAHCSEWQQQNSGWPMFYPIALLSNPVVEHFCRMILDQLHSSAMDPSPVLHGIKRPI